MGWQDDARCVFPIKFARDSLALMKAMLDPEYVMHSGCRVKKHPGACVLCVKNNDCARLPIHPRCRCEPDVYLLALE